MNIYNQNLNTAKKQSRNLILLISTIVIAISSLSNLAYAKTVVGITQIINHESLNANRVGIESVLKQRKDIEIIYYNPQNNMIVANQIAVKLVNNSDIVVGISTPSAQTLLNARKDKNIPLVFSGVTDPISAKIIDKLEQPGNNITGAIDTPPLDELLAIVKQVTNAKAIGVIYNSSEQNSVKTIAMLKQIAGDIKIIESPVSKIADVGVATKKLIGLVDAIILPSDNTVYSALDYLVNITTKAKLPVFSSDSDSVSKGILLSVGYNQRDVGILAGQKILQIIDGKNAGTINISTPEKYEIVINERSATIMNINIDKEILAKAKIIGRNS